MAPNAVPGVPILFRTVPCSERVPNMFRTCSAPQSKKKEKQKKKDNKEKKLLPPIILFSSLPSVWSFLLGLFLRLLPRRLCLRLLLRRPPLIHSPSFVPPIPSPSLYASPGSLFSSSLPIPLRLVSPPNFRCHILVNLVHSCTAVWVIDRHVVIDRPLFLN